MSRRVEEIEMPGPDEEPEREPAEAATPLIYRPAALWSSRGLKVSALKFAIFLAIPIVITIVLAILAQAIISGH